MHMIRAIIIILTFLYGHAAHAGQGHQHDIKHGALTLSDIRIKALMPGAKVSAGYLDIMNKGSRDDTLIGVSLAGVTKSEIHSMEMNGGIMKMRPVEGGIIIPAGDTVSLAPGGYHLMFMNIQDFPATGQTGKLTLTFAEAGTITMDAPVKNIKPSHNNAHNNTHGNNQSHNQGHAHHDEDGHFFGNLWSSFLGLFANDNNHKH